MHTVLPKDTGFRRTTLSSPTLDRLLRQQRNAIQDAIRYYRLQGAPVPTTHPLAKLVNSFTFSLTQALDDLFMAATFDVYDLAELVGITTSHQEQPPFDSLFYASSSDYLILDNRIQLKDVDQINENNWRSLRPVRVLYHPYRMHGYTLPTGGGAGEYHSVIAVDVTALALFYALWLKYDRVDPEGHPRTNEHFIGRYVLPNMLYSQMDVTLLNMLYHDTGVTREDRLKRTAPMVFTTFESDIEQAVLTLAERAQGGNLLYTDWLDAFPSIDDGTTLMARLPEIQEADTLANYRTQFLAWTPWIDALLYHTVGAGHLGKLQQNFRLTRRRVQNRGTIRKLSPTGHRHGISAMYDRIDITLL